jgi:hypothetical protein
MKKNLLLLLLVLPAMLMAQDSIPPKNWKWTGLTGINLNQAAFANWTAGGINSVAFSALGKFTGDYTKNKVTWNNNLNLMYGLVKNENESLKKNQDLIELISVLGYNVSKKWSVTAYMSFRTQFAPGYDVDYDTIMVSDIMAPGYLTLSPSMRFTPNDWSYILLSPVTAKFTFVLDQSLANLGSFGVTPAVYDSVGGQWVMVEQGENMLVYCGPFMEAYMKKDIAKNLNFESRLNIMYTFLNRENLDPWDMDVSWENFINYKIAKYFTASILLHFVYLPGQPMIKFETQPDGIVVPKAEPNKHVQIKETLGIGITYSFPNTK